MTTRKRWVQVRRKLRRTFGGYLRDPRTKKRIRLCGLMDGRPAVQMVAEVALCEVCVARLHAIAQSAA